MKTDKLPERLARLAPAQRDILKRLLSRNTAANSVISVTFEKEALRSFHSPASRDKASTRQFYNAINQHLDSTIFGACSTFLNYGYVGDDSPQMSRVKLPNHTLDQTSVKLVLELIGDCPLDTRKILDVGCGRGGSLSVVNRFFDASLKVGLDLSSTAIAYCHKAHRLPNTYFLEGDAEQLPFSNGTFEVVLNLESSHSYPHINSFYEAVRRVLMPGGCFLYADIFSPPTFDMKEVALQQMGFVIEKRRDITHNVLLSCRQTALMRSQAFAPVSEQHVIEDFLSLPGSTIFDAMETGSAVYRILKMKRI